MRFLEREVYTFAGSRRNAVGPHFFCLWEGRRSKWQTGRRWVAGDTREELAGRATREERHAKAREKREKRSFFFFSGERLEGVCFVLWVEVEIGAQLSRPWGIGTAAKTMRARAAAQGEKNPACGGLWPPFQLIQLIYLRYLCGSAEREKRMDVCFLLTLYI